MGVGKESGLADRVAVGLLARNASSEQGSSPEHH